MLLAIRILALSSLALAGAASAAPRSFTIGGETFVEADIVDARAQPQIGGGAAILLSFEGLAAKRIAAITGKLAGKAVPVTLDGETISAPVVAAPVTDGALQISNAAWTTDAATALAKRISGKEPLPESLEE